LLKQLRADECREELLRPSATQRPLESLDEIMVVTKQKFRVFLVAVSIVVVIFCSTRRTFIQRTNNRKQFVALTACSTLE
jgi:hypothetical protein